MIEEILNEPLLYRSILYGATFMKLLVIMTGLPGSGKSTIAKLLQEDLIAKDISCTVHSTDDYFMNEKKEYNFNPSLLSKFHMLNLQSVQSSDAQVVIVDNTNLIHEYLVKLTTSIPHRFPIKLCTLKQSSDVLFKRCVHNIALHKIQHMNETYTPEKVYEINLVQPKFVDKSFKPRHPIDKILKKIQRINHQRSVSAFQIEMKSVKQPYN